MNELAKQFIEYLDKCEFATKYKIGFAEMFVASLFAESRNCRISEGHQKLFLNTARSLLNKNIDEACTARGMYRNTLNERHLNEAASEIAEYAATNHQVKKVVNAQLRAERKELFNANVFTDSFAEFSLEEPVTETFTYWLDFIDQMKVKGLNEYQAWYEVKRKLVVFLRIANATFQPGESARCVSIQANGI